MNKEDFIEQFNKAVVVDDRYSKLHGIKFIKDMFRTTLGLKEAKDIIDEACNDEPMCASTADKVYYKLCAQIECYKPVERTYTETEVLELLSLYGIKCVHGYYGPYVKTNENVLYEIGLDKAKLFINEFRKHTIIGKDN